MALTKVGGGIIQQPIDVGIITATSVNASGVVTATSFDGNVTGDVTGNVTGNLTGNVTGNVTGNADTASNLTGTPNITVGSVTATTGNFSGNLDVGGVLTYEDVTNVDAVGIVTARIGVKASNIQIGVTGGTEIDTTSGNLTLDSAGGTTTVDDYLTVTGGGNVSAGDWTFTGASSKNVTWDNSEGALEWADDAKATFGSGNDLRLYHNGSNNYIDNTSDLYVRVNGSETAIYATANGKVALNYDSSNRIETTATGATVTGTLVSDGVTSELDLSAISASISDTAVDVFIYDTSKDSDGGAWRKRTQHTSWYNETLNTNFRGSRREFPAVAVIVAETNLLTIYDGDDPDLPMWMVFQPRSDGSNESGQSFLSSYTTPTAVAMLNGIIYCSHTHNGDYWRIGLTSANFLEDSIYSHTRHGDFKFGISKRNSNILNKWMYNLSGNIVNNRINDVAMTVLPNAPIDDATGLPIPTIAVATDGGVSIIKDDGTIVDITASGYTATDNKIDFDYLNNLLYLESGGFPQRQPIPSADIIRSASGGRDRVYGGTSSYVPTILGTSSNIVTNSDGFLSGSTSGLSILDYDSSQSQEMVAYIASDYNTGWMHGDIKGAFLSDTDDTNITGSEKIANHDFSADFSTQWEAANNATTSYDATNDRVTVTSTQNYSGIQLKSASLPTLTAGKRYIMTVDIHSITNPIYFGVISGLTVSNVNAAGVWTGVFTASNVTEVFIKKPTGSNSTFVLNSVSIREAEEDRSVNNKGLQVFGTINKSAVATGAELVNYHGFTSSNYLRHRSTINYGNAATITMGGWSKIPGSAVDANYNYLCSVKSGGEVVGLSIHIDDGGSNAGKPYFYDVTNSSLQSTGPRVDDNEWHHIIGVLDGISKKLYIDGELIVSGTVTGINLSAVDITNVGHYVPAGNNTPNYNHGGYLALIKFSASAPTAEQVKKMYEDEKHLFEENAKATLYGSSDAVTGLAFDDDTDLLHVGTSSGRSDFQGLRRINNTTTAVTTAITAQNEFIIEQ